MKIKLDFDDQMIESKDEEIEKLNGQRRNLRLQLENMDRLEKNEKYEKNQRQLKIKRQLERVLEENRGLKAELESAKKADKNDKNDRETRNKK